MDKYTRYIVSGIVIIAITLVSCLLRKSFSKSKIKGNKADEKATAQTNIIRQPKQYLYSGIIIVSSFVFSSLFVAFMPEHMIVNYEDGMKLALISVLMPLMLGGICFIILQLNWKIEIKEGEFEFTNTFGRKRTYRFDEIEVRQLSKCTRFYKNKRHIVGISMLQDNYDALEKAIFRSKRELSKKEHENNSR